MTETTFCAGAMCQRMQPFVVDEQGVRSCAVCHKNLGVAPMEDVAEVVVPSQSALIPPDPRLVEQIAALEIRLSQIESARGKQTAHMTTFLKGLQHRVEALEATPPPPRRTAPTKKGARRR